jgi:hypothetical protein
MEPTTMSWLGSGYGSGCRRAMVEARHSAKLRAAVAGKNKSDVIDAIDAEMLASCAEVAEMRHCGIPISHRASRVTEK